jgi:hypothetical protein
MWWWRMIELKRKRERRKQKGERKTKRAPPREKRDTLDAPWMEFVVPEGKSKKGNHCSLVTGVPEDAGVQWSSGPSV